MKLKSILENLPVSAFQMDNLSELGELAEIEITGCYIGDLLSNVLAHARQGELWLTVQTHQNVVAIAQLLNLGGVVFLEGHLPQEDTVKRAKREKIPLLTTQERAFEFAAHLSRMGLGRKA
jgi:hypothetical protein